MRKYAGDIEKAALANVRKDFQKAAKQSQNSLNHVLENVDQVISDSRFPYRDELKFRHALIQLRFLQHASKGDYLRQSFDSTMMHKPVWEDYLNDINRHVSGFNSANINRITVDELIAKNGPKKMQKRLESFLKRRIKKAVKSCQL